MSSLNAATQVYVGSRWVENSAPAGGPWTVTDVDFKGVDVPGKGRVHHLTLARGPDESLRITTATLMASYTQAPEDVKA
ncbi:hypothetical protein [Corallococcus macrosporus]|uniref:Uncharacterized protein n=1 Tax=Corallococcus macrosporus DSM 14697 TaxID=1189310 RepID=A0A250K024_9BACT|nr:hypothetical protein [Corallococcus macrosporus]ATB49459.1 hypothetical protein MYMAC_005104 [Corallococcus macrosporus DSM 14697]